MKKIVKNLNIKALFTSRSFRVGGYSVAAAAIVIAIAVVVNILVGALPSSYTKYDTTSNQMYSVSAQTKKMVSALEKDVTVYWIVQSGTEDSTLEVLLDRYDSLSAKLTVIKKDPDVYPTFLSNYGVTDVYTNSLLVECGDRYRYIDNSDIFEMDMMAYYYYGSTDTDFDGENELTSAISFVTSDDLPTMYILTGHGETKLSDTFSSAVSADNIDTAELSLLTEDAVPEDADALLICAPESDISEDEAAKIREYLSSGGKLMLLTNLPEDGSLDVLCSVMADYGVTAEDGLVIEGNRNYYVQGYPIYILPEEISHDITDPLIDDGYYVVTPVAQGLKIADTLPDGVTVDELLSTTDSSFSKSDGYDLQTYDKEDGDVDGPFSVAVAVTDENTGAQAVWISTSGILDDTMNSLVSGGNEDFFLNAINWMCEREDSISIRAKTAEYEYLTVSSGQSSVYALVLIGVLPIACMACGLVIWIRRKRR